ncbi:MAG: hypothetical protein M5R36_15445 [Deltaproteobacteria bacterium]|nr:hypothetical protein [Deltaproteobacteria bacterium]
MRWCEIVQESLLAGDLGILRCQTNDADFNPGKTVEVEVKAGSTLLWSKTETLPQPSLQPSYITPSTDGMELLVHVRNDGTEVTAVTGLSIDGIDVSDFIVVDNETIGPGEVAVIRVLRCDGIPPGDWTVFTVVGETAKGAVSASRALRLFEPKFLIGNWNGSGGDVFTDVERRQEQMDLGINLFLWYPQPAFPPETILPLAEANDFYLWTHTGGFNPGDYFATTVENYGDDPRWFSNATCGECDGQSWESGVEALDEVRAHRSLWPEPKPQWLYSRAVITTRFSHRSATSAAWTTTAFSRRNATSTGRPSIGTPWS